MHRPITIPSEVMHVIWYYWKVQGADSVRTDQMKMSRSVIERREVSPSAKRTLSQNKHSCWFLMGWHCHFFPHFYRQLHPQSHKPGGHYGIMTNFPDLIQFSPKRQKTPPYPCHWNDASYILYMLTDRFGAVFHDSSILPAHNDLNREVWNCQNTSAVK